MPATHPQENPAAPSPSPAPAPIQIHGPASIQIHGPASIHIHDHAFIDDHAAGVPSSVGGPSDAEKEAAREEARLAHKEIMSESICFQDQRSIIPINRLIRLLMI
jgi:hypothetical protein